MILHEKTKSEFGYEFDTAPITRKFYCICDYCGKEFLRDKKTIKQCNQTISKDSCGIGICKKTKSEEVQLIKYGVKNKGGTKETMEKRENTCLEKYGNKSYAKSEDCLKANQEKYGVDHHTQTQEWKDKVKQVRLDTIGVDHHTKSPEYQEQLKERCQEKYGYDHFMQTPEFKEKLKNVMIEKYGKYYIGTDECRDKIIKTCIAKYGVAFPLNKKFGKTQKQIMDWLNSFGFNFKSDILVIENKEIDLYEESRNIGLEYCGLYWHCESSPSPKEKGYHYSKYKNCLDKGIRLITIFEDEWIFRRDQCKDYLKSVLGIFDRRIYARNCVISKVDKKTANEFYDKNHILGKSNLIKISFGLFHKEELIGIVSLGRHHRRNNDSETIVLDRLCFKGGVQVVGGASKLFSKCVKWSKENRYVKIISWSDNRWSNGGIYRVLGFKLDEDLPPDYSYVDLNTHFIRVSKQSQKKNESCPEGMTEREWCLSRGLARIWDCGKKRWIFYLKP